MNQKLICSENKQAFIWVTFLFFLWGIPNNLNGILIKQFMKSFELSIFEASLVQSVFYIGYFIFAIPAALILRRFGYKQGLLTGLILFAVGCLLFWPAAHLCSYAFFLFSLFIIASGLTFLETGANPFIVELGDKQTAERRLNFSQSFNPIGSILGVIIGTLFVFSGIDPDPQMIEEMKLQGSYESFLKKETLQVVLPYIMLAIVAFIWVIVAIRIRFPRTTQCNNMQKSYSWGYSVKQLFRNKSFLKGVFSLFMYVGAQVGTWSYFIFYAQRYTGASEKEAGYMLTGTIVAFALGRILSTELMKHISPVKLMYAYGSANILLVLVSLFFTNAIGLRCLLATSFFMSIMYPTLFSLSVKGLGEQQEVGSSILVMSILGGAVVTPLMGYIMDKTEVSYAMCIPLIAYICITKYSYSIFCTKN